MEDDTDDVAPVAGLQVREWIGKLTPVRQPHPREVVLAQRNEIGRLTSKAFPTARMAARLILPQKSTVAGWAARHACWRRLIS
jgi:hypothetical protein